MSVPWSVTLTVGADEHVFTGRARCVLGRGPECDIPVAAGRHGVSRRHCQVEVRPPHVHVRDLGSRNGTYLNGVALDPAHGERELVDGDELRIGDTTVRVAVRAGGGVEPLPGLRVLRELGRGGQGVVHLARHAVSGRLVAVKTLTAQGSVDPAARAAFLRELESTAVLRHPHIVRFLGAGAVADGVLSLCCEYCPGGSVADLVRHRGGRLPAAEAVPLVLQALDALAYAHRAAVPVRLADGSTATGRGLVHRDLTPRNLLLAAPGVLKIADFGLAKAFDTAGLSGRTHTGAISGSVAFMPRRQLLDYKYARPEVDLWAVAACLYWMLTGTTAREFPPGADPVATVLREPSVPVRDRLATVPAALAAAIDRALDETAGAGPATADALARTLRSAL